MLIIWKGLRTICGRWNNGCSAARRDGTTKRVSVVGFVGYYFLKRQISNEVFCLADIVDLACSKDKANGITERVNRDTHFRAESTAGTPQRLILAPPFWRPRP